MDIIEELKKAVVIAKDRNKAWDEVQNTWKEINANWSKVRKAIKKGGTNGG